MHEREFMERGKLNYLTRISLFTFFLSVHVLKPRR